MKNKLVVDIELLKDYDLSINDFCALWKLYNEGNLDFNDYEVDYEKLQEKRFLKIITEDEKKKFILRGKTINLIETEAKKSRKSSSKKENSNVDVVTRLSEYRNIWKGLKAGSMGSPGACREKLTQWLKENPEYTFDDVLKAANMYIESLNGDYNYLQQADYFISKVDKNRIDHSKLSAFIEEIDNEGLSQGDWTTNMI